MYLFFDTETNGFPPKCNMTQLAFMLVDEVGGVMEEFQSIIKPKDWIVKDVQWYLDNGYSKEEAVKKGGFFTDNNISTYRCEKEGEDVFLVLRQLQAVLKVSKYKIAHNIAFDNKVILKELKSNNITHQLFQYKKGLCTMRETRNFFDVFDKNNRKKNPSMQDLHQYLFNENFDGAHDALADVRALKDCFFELKNRDLIKI